MISCRSFVLHLRLQNNHVKRKSCVNHLCDTFLYFWNRLHHCGCDLRTVKRNKSRLNNGGGNHCCTCLTPIKYKDAYNNQAERKLKCEACFENKRSLTPNSDKEDSKRTKIEEPEDPMLDMDLNPIPQNKEKK